MLKKFSSTSFSQIVVFVTVLCANSWFDVKIQWWRSFSINRDDDNDKSDDDENERIDFSVNTQARDRIKIQNEFLAAEHGN